jgi:putative ABC transport system permease protein
LIEDVKGRAGIQRQITLPLAQSLRMTKNSIFIRMGRSVITAAGIFLGIAFMCSVFAGTAVKAGLPPVPGQEMIGTGAKNIWLVAIALVVATIGIINSMLMAVTERYKEIGTMKCLGALDGLVVRLFLLESGLLGLLGAIVGAIVGTGFGLLMAAARNGWGSLGHMGAALSFGLRAPGWLAIFGAMIAGAVVFLILRWILAAVTRQGTQLWLSPAVWGLLGGALGLVLGELRWQAHLTEIVWKTDPKHPLALGLWASVGLSIVLGAILAVAAAVYPAQQAAKMPPAAALRVEI